MIRKLRDLADFIALLAILAVVAALNLAGRIAWTIAHWPRRGRTPGA